MPSLKLHGREVQMSDLSVEELQSNIAACQLMFPKWRSGYQVILAGELCSRYAQTATLVCYN